MLNEPNIRWGGCSTRAELHVRFSPCRDCSEQGRYLLLTNKAQQLKIRYISWLRLCWWRLHDDAFTRAAHGAPSSRVDSLVAFALRAVLRVICNLVSRAGAVVAIAPCVPSGDLVLAAVFDDTARTHCEAGGAVEQLGLSRRR